MIDALALVCNSRYSGDRRAEITAYWKTTDGVWPIDLHLWNTIADRMMATDRGTPEERETEITEMMKAQYLKLAPKDSVWQPLTLEIQQDKNKGQIKYPYILSEIEAVEREKANEDYTEALRAGTTNTPPEHKRTNGAKTPDTTQAAKRKREGGQKTCIHHPQSTSHTTEECKSKGAGANRRDQAPNAKKPLRERLGLTAKSGPSKPKPPPTDQVSTSDSAKLHALEARLARLEASDTDEPAPKRTKGARRVLGVKREAEEVHFHLAGVSDADLTATPIVLDSGAESHVGPISLPLENIEEVLSKRSSIIDATNNVTPIQHIGDFNCAIGGTNVSFVDVHACAKVSDTLISCSSWLSGTEDSIILKSDGAFYRQADCNDLHQIARVVNGLYYMYPLHRLGENSRKAMTTVVHSALTGLSLVGINICAVKDGGHVTELGIHPSDWNTLTDNAPLPTYELPTAQPVRTFMLRSRNLDHSHSTTDDDDKRRGGIDHVTDSLMKLHVRFGHSSLRSILFTLKCSDDRNKSIFTNEIKFLSANGKLFPKALELCTHCAKGKIVRSPTFDTQSPARKILDRIHTDCVPILQSRYKEKHGTLVVDGKSRYMEIVFHPKKSEHFAELKGIITRWERQHEGLHVGAVRHDGGELQLEFAAFCKARDPMITDEPSPPYAKEFNGLVERNYASLKGTAITMLDHSRLPQSYVRFALAYAVFVKNRMVHSSTGKFSPYQLWFGRPADMTKLQPFGCQVTMHLDKVRRQDYYGSRGAPGLFLGYHGQSLAIVLLLSNFRIIMSHDVVFHATLFPGLHHETVQREPAPGSTSTSSRYPLRSHVSGGATAPAAIEAPTTLEQETRDTAVLLNQEGEELDGMPDIDDASDDDEDDDDKDNDTSECRRPNHRITGWKLPRGPIWNMN
jgi:hypothetical protein